MKKPMKFIHVFLHLFAITIFSATGSCALHAQEFSSEMISTERTVASLLAELLAH